MPPEREPSGTARSAAAINEEIRALWARPVTCPTDTTRRYELLLVEWEAAVRTEQVLAA
ncbi:hypothetical protein [Streptomyces formicae]|uniref:Uncharacterized protein n=1 Tax=Streptomyces formicae TaxID=1616117 RepID=A0ABY3WRN4_9ACTN|nr:hypothetical protein [Streptomyces formicae]UNM15301.1 hypothetical protein J4032_30975 [Streptomyces formicae]